VPATRVSSTFATADIKKRKQWVVPDRPCHKQLPSSRTAQRLTAAAAAAGGAAAGAAAVVGAALGAAAGGAALGVAAVAADRGKGGVAAAAVGWWAGGWRSPGAAAAAWRLQAEAAVEEAAPLRASTAAQAAAAQAAAEGEATAAQQAAALQETAGEVTAAPEAVAREATAAAAVSWAAAAAAACLLQNQCEDQARDQAPLSLSTPCNARAESRRCSAALGAAPHPAALPARPPHPGRPASHCPAAGPPWRPTAQRKPGRGQGLRDQRAGAGELRIEGKEPGGASGDDGRHSRPGRVRVGIEGVVREQRPPAAVGQCS
jgi:hypothetical protein